MVKLLSVAISLLIPKRLSSEADAGESDDDNPFLEILDDNPSAGHRIALVLEVIAFGFWFIMCLSRTADTWFCNSLLNLCDLFHLRHGVVSQLLALAGALPDILSQVSCMTGDEESISPDMSVGEVVGNAFMLYGLLLPLLHFMTPGRVIPINKPSFIYDNIWFFVTIALLIGFGYIGIIGSWVIILFMILYIVYFALSIYFFDRKKKHPNSHIDSEQALNSANEEDSLSKDTSVLGDDSDEENNKDNENERSHGEKDVNIVPIDSPIANGETLEVEAEEKDKEDEALLSSENNKKNDEYESAFDKVNDFSEWWPKGWFTSLIGWGPKVMDKIVAVISFPFTIFQVFSLPSVSQETYSRLTSTFGHIGSFLLIANRCGAIDDDNMAYAIPICIALGVAFAIAFGILSGKKPFSKVMNVISTIIALVTSVFFMDIFADSLVDLLKAFGNIFSIPESVLGIILAYAAASSDISGNIAVARSGNSISAVCACAQASLINALFGSAVSWIPGAIPRGFKDFDYNINMHSIIALSCVLVIIVYFSLAFGIVPHILEKKGYKQYAGKGFCHWTSIRNLIGLLLWCVATITIILTAIYVDEKK